MFRCSKIIGEACKQEILQQCSEKSRSQIVFRTDIFRKLTLGASDTSLEGQVKRTNYYRTDRLETIHNISPISATKITVVTLKEN